MNNSTPHNHSGLSLFFLRYLVVFGVLATMFYLAIEHSNAIRAYIEWHTHLCSVILNSSFGEQTSVHTTIRGFNNELQTHDRAYIQIEFGGMGYFASALIAGIVAWPCDSIGRKVYFTAGAFALMLFLHFAQSMALLEIEIWWSKHLALLSEVVVPMAIGIIPLLYFLVWIKASGRHPMH